MYAFLRAHPEYAKAHFNSMSSSLEWSAEAYHGSRLSIFRSPIPLRSSTTPVMVTRIPSHPTLSLPLPGMVPHQLVLTLNHHTLAALILGSSEDTFHNYEITHEIAKAFNRHFAAHFAFFDRVRHLISNREDLVDDMSWAGFDLENDLDSKLVFRRQPRNHRSA
jgi:hypothetical protein